MKKYSRNSLDKIHAKAQKGLSVRKNEISREIVDAAYQIHTKLGADLLELVYEAVMAYRLQKRDLKFKRQKPIPVVYEGIHLKEGEIKPNNFLT